jgi:hypothetical protein
MVSMWPYEFAPVAACDSALAWQAGDAEAAHDGGEEAVGTVGSAQAEPSAEQTAAWSLAQTAEQPG